MKAAKVFVLICVAAMSTTAKADGKCEKIENLNWGGSFRKTIKTCFMTSTVIDSKDFLITSDRDETIEGFDAAENKRLEHLPNNLGAKHPSLLGLSAWSCSIKKVSKDNFKGLGNLRGLFLHDNQIEKIDDDTFEYISAVEQINLSGNKIKKLNGRAFASLHKLAGVWLLSNECINEDFGNAIRIAESSRIVTEKCGFTESEATPTKIVEPEADLMAQSAELQALKLENARLQTGNVKLRIEKAEADLQTAHLNELQAQHNEIKAQLKETCDARIELKLQEIYHCSNDLQSKTAEINEKNEKIKQCEKKNQILGGDGP